MACTRDGCVRPPGHNGPCIDGNNNDILQEMLEIEPEITTKLPVTVNGMSGKALQLQQDPFSCVSVLKEEVQLRWGVPRLCQRLLLGDADLRDDQRVADLFEKDAESLQVSLLLSLKRVDASFHFSTVELELEVLQYLDEEGISIGQPAVQAAADRMYNAHADVRSAAARTVAKLSGELRDICFSAVHSCINQEIDDVRVAALESLAKFDPPFEDRAVELACTCLGWNLSGFSQAHLTAVEVLQSIARRGHPCVSQTLRGFLGRDELLTAGVLRAMPKLLPRGCAEVADVIVSLTDPAASVRVAALQVLPDMAREGDERALASVCNCLDDPLVHVKSEAVKCWGRLAKHGDRTIVAKLLPHLTDLSSHVRVSAAESLVLVCDWDDNDAVAKNLMARLQKLSKGDPVIAVRTTVSSLLDKWSDGG